MAETTAVTGQKVLATTHASDRFLKTAREKVVRWPGHAIFTAVAETALNVGSTFLAGAGHIKPALDAGAKIPEVAALIADATSNYVYYAMGQIITGGFAATGVAGLLAGSYIGAQGIKHAQNDLEKVAFWGSKAALVGAYFLAPALVPIAAGVSAVSTLISMRHRK